MLKTLIKIRMQALFSAMFKGNNKKGGKSKIILLIILGIYILGCFGVLFGGIFASICEPFASLGMGWLYFGFMAVMIFVLCFIGSVFVTQNQLYDAKDNEMLLAMPIPPRYILVSRLLSLLGLNYIYEILIIIPAAVVYCIKQPVTPLGIVFFIIGALMLPMLVMSVSALLGWIIALISSKMRNKNMVTMVLSLVLFLGYMYVCFQLQDYIQKLVANGAAIGEAIEKALPPFYYLGVGIVDRDPLSMLYFVVWCVVPFVIVYSILSRTFIQVATSNKGKKKIKYQEKTMKTMSIRRALIYKEIKHFTGTPMYMFNAGIGLVFLVIGAVYVLIKHSTIMQSMSMFGNYSIGDLAVLLCFAAGLMSSLTIISAPTISIEAKTMWIAKSSPVDERDILLAKADMHILISLPFLLISSLLVSIAMDFTVINILMLFIFPIVVTIFDAYLGVFLNLKFPKFDWVNEIVAIKQGLSTLLAMFVSMASVALPGILYIVLIEDYMSMENFLFIVFGIFLIAAFVLYKYLVTKGVEIYRNL